MSNTEDTRRAREALIDHIRQVVARDWAHWAVAFTEAAAERLGLYAADLRYLNVIAREGAVTAGELARATGLTTGAVTGVIDRLERQGYVRRDHDPADRRRVIVRINGPAMARAGKVFGSSQREWAETLNSYTDDELAFIVDFLTKSTRILREETAKLRGQAEMAQGNSGT